MRQIALIGNPNTGKTTLFNALTGSSQHVGNWAGVTVERKSGCFNFQDEQIEVIDLPGIYSLNVDTAAGSLDEKIACDYLFSEKPSLVVNIVDAAHLERSLYLTIQLQEMGVPILLAVTMLDIAKLRRKKIDLKQLAAQFNCPVVGIHHHGVKALQPLKSAMMTQACQPTAAQTPIYDQPLEQAIQLISEQLTQTLPLKQRWLAIRCLEGDGLVQSDACAISEQTLQQCQNLLQIDSLEDADIRLADARYALIVQRLAGCLTTAANESKTLTAMIDKVVLNKYLGIPIFLGMMYLMFVVAINIGGAFQDFFEIISDTLFVGGLTELLTAVGVNAWITALLASGVGVGITTTAGFIPVIGGLFLFLSLLEGSGYMARAAFVMDRVMRAMGLPGKAFVPLIVGFGCNVPAVMATRTLEHRRDRILVAMMSPFMSCGARLAIYAVFVAAFFPSGGQNIVFLLYLIGIAMAISTGLILRKTLLQGSPSPMIMEMPPYHIPRLKNVMMNTWQRLKGFLTKASKVIIPLCFLIGFLNAVTVNGELKSGAGDQHSVLSVIGKSMTPILTPMGVNEENWPATVGIMTGMLAKEVVVATLNTLYSQAGNLALEEGSPYSFWGGLKEAVMSVPKNIVQLGASLKNPIAGSMPEGDMTQAVYGEMFKRFDGKIGAFAYLLFLLLYFPCVSTIAVMARELNHAWAALSVCWSTAAAYGIAVGFYQLATIARHPWSSLAWVFAILTIILGFLFGSQRFATRSYKPALGAA